MVIAGQDDDVRAVALRESPDLVIVESAGDAPLERRVATLRQEPLLASVAIVVTGIPVGDSTLTVRARSSKR